MYTVIWILVLYSMCLVSVLSTLARAGLRHNFVCNYWIFTYLYQPCSDAVISLWKHLMSIAYKSRALVAMV